MPKFFKIKGIQTILYNIFCKKFSRFGCTVKNFRNSSYYIVGNFSGKGRIYILSKKYNKYV